MLTPERHMRRILESIERGERKRTSNPPKDRPVTFRRPRRTLRWDRYLPWEGGHDDAIHHRQ
jgi:hypothetical protein